MSDLRRSAKYMTPSDISRARKTAAWALAVVAGLAVSYVCLLFWGLVGVLTHVIAMCSDAPHWWSITYMWLTVLILIPGYGAARSTHLWFVARSHDKLRDEE